MDDPQPPQTQGNPAGQGGVIPFPGYLAKRADGIFIDPAKLSPESAPADFINLLFTSGQRFSGLIYEAFLQLLYGDDPGRDAAPIRLAGAVLPFEPARQALYKGVRINADASSAEYFFEPVELEIVEQVEVPGPPGPDGQPTGLVTETRTHRQPTRLDFDEFVADMWIKGVRYGIDAEAVRKAIGGGENTRLEIARMLAPVEGTDASIKEVCAALHRDDTPKTLPDGRQDLTQFANRFPQIDKNVPLLKKIPRAFGKDGVSVAGKRLAPAGKPKDFDLQGLCGAGTRVEKREDGEYMVSAIDGFLDIDATTNQISITEKIIHKEGISLKTTGDLHLAGDDFEAHGDVQEGRQVEGKHMTLHGNVFGGIVSHGGKVVIKGNIVAGQASSPGGSILIEGRASQSKLEAIGGEIRLDYAEGCAIFASKVVLKHAVYCDIIADSLEVETLEGSALNAHSLQTGTCNSRKDVETVITLRIPDASHYQAKLDKLRADADKLRQAQAGREQELAVLREHPDLVKFLAIETKVRKGEIKLTPAQAEQLRQVGQRHGVMLKKMRDLGEEVKKLTEAIARIEAGAAEVLESQRQESEGIGCRIGQILGETLIRTRACHPLDLKLNPHTVQEFAPRLRERSPQDPARIFHDEQGSLDWHYEPPSAAGDAAV